MDTLAPVYFEGVLEKKGDHMQNWKRRFVSVRGNILRYYFNEDRHTNQETARGSFIVAEVGEANDSGMWSIRTHNGRELTFRSSNALVREKALQALEKAVEFNGAKGTVTTSYTDISQEAIVGVALGELGLFEDAIEVLKEAVSSSSDKRRAHSHFHLGSCLLASGQETQAVKAFETAKALDPRFLATYNNLGIALLILGQYEQSISNFVSLLEIVRANERNEGPNLTSSRRTERSRSTGSAPPSSSSSPSDSSQDVKLWEVHNNLGIAYWKASRPIDAEEMFEKAIKQNPSFANPLLNLGDLSIEANRGMDVAINYFQRAVEAEPRNPHARVSLAIHLSKSGNSVSACDNLRVAARLEPTNITILTLLVRALRANGEEDEAETLEQHLVSLGGDQVSGRTRGGNGGRDERELSRASNSRSLLTSTGGGRNDRDMSVQSLPSKRDEDDDEDDEDDEDEMSEMGDFQSRRDEQAYAEARIQSQSMVEGKQKEQAKQGFGSRIRNIF